MPESVEGNEFGSDLVQRPQFGTNRSSALGIGAASFASVLGTRFGIWELGTGFFERGKNKKRAKI